MTIVHLEGLPPGYRLEEDPDILTLYRGDGSEVAAFSPHAARPEAILLAAQRDGDGDASGTSRKGILPQGAAARGRFRVRFLGGFELLYDDVVVPRCRNARALAILKYLLAQGERPVSRDFLMCWLWPDSNLKKARWSLNSSVHALRRFLADHLLLEQEGEILLFQEGHYRLHPNLLLTSDVEEFDERYARGRRLERGGSVFEAVREYETAVELYRGDYLPEDLYEDWTMVERERLAGSYVYMLDRLAIHYANTGRYQRAVEMCYRILEQDPCHEDSHRRLIGHYVRLGLREQALRQYRVCAQALKSRYGVEPSPETRDVYRDVLAGETGRKTQAS
ncbi:MAG: BTAD domain-containing putative transcriptional regulator [Actinomycetota bacterium]